MPKHRRKSSRRHSSPFELKLKNGTLRTLSGLLLFVLSGVTLLSFSRQGMLLDVNQLLLTLFGWTSVFFPISLFFTGLLFTRAKFKFAKPHVAVGFALSWVAIGGLFQSGIVGEEIYRNIADVLSNAGAILLLMGALVVGLVVLFNMSLDEMIVLASPVLALFAALGEKIKGRFTQKPGTVYVQDQKIAAQKMQNPIPIPASPIIKQAEPKKEEKDTSLLGTAIVANLANNSGIWEYPPLSLLSDKPGQKADRGDIKKNAQIIESTLQSFGIQARVVEVNLGPAVTQYAIEIALGTKLSKITALANDLALALAAPTGQIRIEAPIPGRSLVGIEIPNHSLEFVTLRQMLSSPVMQKAKDKLTVAMGLDVSGQPVTANLAKMPHVLIAGTTGSGKSVMINTFITSLLFRTTPSEVKLILIDPKRVEMAGYNGIPHLLTPVIVEADKILSALKWAIGEMNRRYKIFAEAGVRNIDGYNEFSGFQAFPYIVIIIDELADLMSYAPVEVEDAICRLAQMSRAVGIHLVIATQRPSVDVITGLIKANVPSRIAFNVASVMDSRVVLDSPGAEKLLGRGDMLYIPSDQPRPTRIQGVYVSEDEVNKLVKFLKDKGLPIEYTEEVLTQPTALGGKKGAGSPDGLDNSFSEAVRIVCQDGKASASLLQRKLSVGYARAARILDQLEQMGIVGPGEGAKPREVQLSAAQEFLASQQQDASSQT